MRLFHTHKWIEINREFGTMVRYWTIREESKKIGEEFVTIITFRCAKCNRLEQQTLKGRVKEELNEI